jgi:hypothetical protein
MSKWADYLVSKVKYGVKPKRIISLKVHQLNGSSVGKEEIWTRSKLIEHIDKNKIFFTIFQNANKQMDKGSQINKIVINNVDYLRTDSNKTEEDNLEKLQEF